MHPIIRWLSRWHGAPLLAAILAIAIPVVFVVRATDGTSDSAGGSSVGQWVLLTLLALLVVIVFLRVAVSLSGVDPDAQLIANRLTPAHDQRRLLARWLQRTRWARNVGGCAGLTWWLFGTSAQGDILLYGVGGVALGSMASQLHHVRRPTGPRIASLERRTLTDYLPGRERNQMLAVAALAFFLVLGGVFATDARSAVGWGVGAIGTLAAAHLVQRRVATRARPALSSGLQRADDLARELAIGRGLAQPATFAALACIAHGAGHLEPSLGGLAVLLAASTWLYALALWWHNRRLGLDHLVHLPLQVAA